MNCADDRKRFQLSTSASALSRSNCSQTACSVYLKFSHVSCERQEDIKHT